jgi:dynactin 1
MTEEEKQEAGYYRLQHDNERLRHALLGLVVLQEVSCHEHIANLN